MAFQFCFVLFLAYFSASFSQADASSCPTWYDSYTGQWIDGFDCPRYYDFSDEYYCCDSYTTSQTCCSYDDYHEIHYGLGVGAYVGIAIGCLVFIAIGIISLIMCCCVCGSKAASRPSTQTVTMQTFPMPQQSGPVTIQQPAAPGYYFPQVPQASPPPSYAVAAAPQAPAPAAQLAA